MDAHQSRKRDIELEFARYDKDGSGSVSVDEAHAILKEKLGLSCAGTRKLVELCDTNKDGQLSYSEFVEFYFTVRQKVAEMEEMFRSFDTDNSGTVSVSEAINVLAQFGFSEQNVKHLFNTHDDNEDGVLEYKEFVKFWNTD